MVRRSDPKDKQKIVVARDIVAGDITIDLNERKASRIGDLPPGMEKLIGKETIDLGNASLFYQTKAEIVAEMLPDFVEKRADSIYQLNGAFAPWFLANLPVCARGFDLQPADCLADCLFRMGEHWAKIDYGERPTHFPLHEQLLQDTWSGIEERWKLFFQSGGGPAGEYWLHTLRKDGSLGPWSDSNPRQVRIGLFFNTDVNGPPSAVVRIEGEAAVTLMRLWMELKRSAEGGIDQQVRVIAETVLTSVLHDLKVNLKLKHPSKGRPAATLDSELVAYLLDHKKKTLPQVASQLSQLPRDPIERKLYFDRIKKAKINFYERLRKNLRALLPVK